MTRAKPIVTEFADHVTIRRAAQDTGLTEKAIRRKIERGDWVEGREFRRTGGHVFISVEGFNRWAKGLV